MFRLRSAANLPFAVACLGTMLGAIRLSAQVTNDQVDKELKSIYQITKFDSINHIVNEQGTIVRVTRGNLLMVSPVGPLSSTCPATVKEGTFQIPSALCRMGLNDPASSFVPEAMRFYITKIKSNPGKDTVLFELIDAAADPNTGGVGRPSVKTSVNFIFPKGYLTKADAGQLADVINSLLVPEGNPQQAGMQQQPAPIEQSPMPQVPPQNDAPAQVVVGMTEAQVRAILGNPTVQTQVPGRGNVFVYTRQITFQNGRVVAVQ